MGSDLQNSAAIHSAKYCPMFCKDARTAKVLSVLYFLLAFFNVVWCLTRKLLEEKAINCHLKCCQIGHPQQAVYCTRSSQCELLVVAFGSEMRKYKNHVMTSDVLY